MAKEIVLSAGTEYVPTKDIPALIAQALNPDATGQPRTVSRFIKVARPGATGEAAKWNGWPIDDDDRKVLAEIWAPLPPFPDKATADQVQPYLEAFKEKGAGLEWELEVLWTNPELNAAILRKDAEQKHRKEVAAAIREGRLKAVSRHTRLPANEYQPDSEVALADLARYVDQFAITVRSAVLAEDLPAIYAQQESAKRADGRYTIREAADLLHLHAGERAEAMVEKLSRAAFEGQLPVYRPGENARHEFARHGNGSDWQRCVRDFYEEAYWDDLNAWLERNEPRVSFRFPAPLASPDDTNAERPQRADPDEKERQRGLGRTAILAAPWPLRGRFTLESLSRALSDVPEWLKPARVSRGAPGRGSAMWNPALLALCLSEKKHADVKALSNVIQNYFSEWHADWEDIQELP